MIDTRPAGSHHGLVLRGIEGSQFFGKNLAHVPAQQLPLLFQAAAFHQRLIDRQISAGTIFDEKRGIRHMIKELLDDGQLRGE
jgi:hypothetical protein